MAELRKFLKVLVVVDGSEYSMNAAEYAVSIAETVWLTAYRSTRYYIRYNITSVGGN